MIGGSTESFSPRNLNPTDRRQLFQLAYAELDERWLREARETWNGEALAVLIKFDLAEPSPRWDLPIRLTKLGRTVAQEYSWDGIDFPVPRDYSNERG